MGRWVTSKGRRIYIPDEGEENPFSKEKASSSIDLSTEGTYKLNGQKAPKDLPEVSDEDAKHNKMVDYKGTKYSTQQVVDWDKEKGEAYVAGYMYVPHNDLSKGSFFVSKDREMYHSGSDYLNAQSKKKAKSLQTKEESTKQKQIAENKKQADERNTTYLNNDISKEEQAYMNAKAIKISKNMPKEKQAELRKLKAAYNKDYKEEKAKRLASSGGKKQYRMDAADWEVRMDDLYSKYSKKFSAEPNAWLNYGEEGKAAYRLYKQAVEKVEPNKRKRAKYFRDRREF